MAQCCRRILREFAYDFALYLKLVPGVAVRELAQMASA